MKIPQTGRLEQQMCISQVLEAGGRRSKHRKTWCLVCSHFLLYTQPSSHCALTGWKQGEIAVQVPLLRALVPLMMAPSSLPNHLPKSLTPDTITLKQVSNTENENQALCWAWTLFNILSLPVFPPSTHTLSLATK